MPPKRKSTKGSPKKKASKGKAQQKAPSQTKTKAKGKVEAKKQSKEDQKSDDVIAMDVDVQELEEKKEKPTDVRALALRAVCDSVKLIQKGVVTTGDRRYISRAVRAINTFRKKMSPSVLEEAISRFVPVESKNHAVFVQAVSAVKGTLMTPEDTTWLQEELEKEAQAKKEKEEREKAKREKQQKAREEREKKSKADGDVKGKHAASAEQKAREDAHIEEEKKEEEMPFLPEVEAFIHLLVLLAVLDSNLVQDARNLANNALARLATPEYNRRTMDLISARLYFYFTLICERQGQLAQIRSTLLELHRTSCLRHDEPGQVVLTNAILRNYLHFSLYTHADKFRLNTTLPESRSSDQHARYLYYLGKINAIQLHYSQAFRDVTQSIRKAPQTGAIGFRQAAHKLSIVIQLLMGEIPERSLFRTPDLERALRPYLQITQAVRVGDLAAFAKAMTAHKASFVKDKNYNLIVRLRHNVIKTGLRKINLSYSKISMADITSRLGLGSVDNAEYIVAKAIHDGVIEAVIDRKNRVLYSKENTDIYSSTEPQSAFHKRIEFCMDIHNGAVKAMHYPENMQRTRVVDSDDEDFDDPGDD